MINYLLLQYFIIIAPIVTVRMNEQPLIDCISKYKCPKINFLTSTKETKMNSIDNKYNAANQRENFFREIFSTYLPTREYRSANKNNKR